MKLAEALNARADAQKRLQQIRQRIQASARHQEGETPPEDPQDLLAEAGRVASDLERLITGRATPQGPVPPAWPQATDHHRAGSAPAAIARHRHTGRTRRLAGSEPLSREVPGAEGIPPADHAARP